MEKLLLKTMGSELDSLCRPARSCNCLSPGRSPGDWYFDPTSPDVILCTPADSDTAVMAKPLENEDTIVNQASGLVYQYNADSGITPVGFAQTGETYLVFGEINGNITVPEHCTLIFQGGSFKGELHGNYTTIQAPAVKIFDINLTLDGTFTNECAYPEWWGAIATNTREITPHPDCTAPIQDAFDSPFYHIEFATGFYFLSDTVILRKRKHVTMQGCGVSGLWDRSVNDFALGTALWTDSKAVALKIDIDKELIDTKIPNKHDQHASLIWDGGCIDVSYYGRKNQSADLLLDDAAVLYCPRAEERTHIKMAIRGPMPYFDSTYHPTSHDIEKYGAGIRLTNSDDHANKQSGVVLSDFDIDIFGFGCGIKVDYERMIDGVEQGGLTSLSIHGLISRCFRYIYAPAGGFSGGVIDCSIQTGHHNRHLTTDTQEPIYLLDGDFNGCYIDSWIWDYPYDCALRSTDTKRMRIGPKMHAIVANTQFSMMMPTETLAGMVGNADGLLNASAGHYDLCALGTNNIRLGGHNYVHMVDNDFLSIDKIIPDVQIEIIPQNLTDFQVVNDSPFDRQGLKVRFTDHTNKNEWYADDNEAEAFANKGLKVTVTLPFNSALYPQSLCTNLLALHLKGKGLPHFNRLKCIVTSSEILGVGITSVRQDTETLLYDGDYASAWNGDARQDIVLPFIFNYGQPKVYLSKLELAFEGLAPCREQYTWWGENTFNLFIEGRFNRHYYNNLFTASGGDLGSDILRNGKPYLLGSKKYLQFCDLPSAAADGAIGVLHFNNGDTKNKIENDYPIIKTPKGWMIQHLVGATDELEQLGQHFGAFSMGQQAFNLTLGKPVWWNGTAWVSSDGTEA